MEDSFNASGRVRARKRKEMTLARKDAVASAQSAINPMAVPMALADEAAKGKISSQAREAWSGVDGFDNAGGKKLTKSQKGALIGFSALILATGLVWGILKLTKKKT